MCPSSMTSAGRSSVCGLRMRLVVIRCSLVGGSHLLLEQRLCRHAIGSTKIGQKSNAGSDLGGWVGCSVRSRMVFAFCDAALAFARKSCYKHALRKNVA